MEYPENTDIEDEYIEVLSVDDLIKLWLVARKNK